METEPVLILGGSGQAGASTGELLRQWHPNLPLTIAGRSLDRAQRVADELGAANAVTIDLARADLGLPAGHSHSAVVATLWDNHLNGLRYAQDHGVPYVSISNGLVEIAPEVVAGGQRPNTAPILLASHFCAGSVLLATVHLARKFARVDSIRVGALLDEVDAGGPAGLADLERLATASSAGLVRRDGVFTWIPEADARVDVRSIDGTMVPGQQIAVLDVPGLALATGAADVQLAFAVGESAGRRRGEHPSIEIRIDLDGADETGAPLSTSQYLVHPAGQRPLTALGIALGVERLIGLRGEPVAPGIYTPEALTDPAFAVERLTELGASFVSADTPALK
ncbi:saccharopine dehydrogenase [Kribbella flavida DSM 17836]|uniref:Saccharopine dehydrogenase n=1 Tax=Kribbella flavida (strain DSM 17836 / JCM 10339 / NBRC 14399) TaxID=479435 RepID=D2PPZ6_KRIFD|nr:saccharopine dehydrogenase [Kribbella flavida]ADB32920.1 saccharopine dehydrogenase [Kribbella flavida DSM 17836]